MPKYRAYLLGHSGQILRRLEFGADDDEAALQHVRDQSSPNDVEVWQADRIVGTVSAKLPESN
jgi:hypothetical protein